MSKIVKVGQVYAPKDKRRDGRRIRVEAKTKFYALVSARMVGQKAWKAAPTIRLDRLLSRAYRVVSTPK